MCNGKSNKQKKEQEDHPTTINDDGDDDTNIPTFAKLWIQAGSLLPCCYFPNTTTMNFSFALLSGLLLLILRIVVTQFMIVYYNWPKSSEDTNDAAASVIGLIHSSTILPTLTIGFLTHTYNPSEQFNKAPKWWQQYVDTFLQFSTGYFIYDTIFIIGNRIISSSQNNNMTMTMTPQLTTDDIMFLIHHFMTTTYMTQTRYYQAGHMSAMMCMLLGEASNPLHNSYLISQIAIKLELSQKSILLETIFSFVYLLFRVFIGPIVCIHMTYELLKNGKKNGLPMWVLIFWNIMIWAVILGSASWIVLTYEMLQTHYTNYWMMATTTTTGDATATTGEL